MSTLPPLPQKPFDTLPECCHTGTPVSGTHSACTWRRPSTSAPARFGTDSLLSACADCERLSSCCLALDPLWCPQSCAEPLLCLTYSGALRKSQGGPQQTAAGFLRSMSMNLGEPQVLLPGDSFLSSLLRPLTPHGEHTVFPKEVRTHKRALPPFWNSGHLPPWHSEW